MSPCNSKTNASFKHVRMKTSEIYNKQRVAVLKAKECTKIYSARAQTLFCSLNILFGGVLVPVAVVVCLRSLLSSLK